MSAARSNAHGGIAAIAARRPATAEPDVRFGSNRAAPVPRLERSVLLVAVLRQVARAADAKRVGVGDDERTGSLRAAQPLLAGDRCRSRGRSRRPVIAPTDCAPSTRIGSPVEARSSCTGITAPVVHRTCDSAMSRVRGVTAATILSGSGSETTTFAPDVWSGPRSPKCSSVVVMTSSPARRSRPASTMLHPSVVDAVSATCSGETPTSAGDVRTKLLARLEEPHEPRVAAASLALAPPSPRRASRRSSRARAARRSRPGGRR